MTSDSENSANGEALEYKSRATGTFGFAAERRREHLDKKCVSSARLAYHHSPKSHL